VFQAPQILTWHWFPGGDSLAVLPLHFIDWFSVIFCWPAKKLNVLFDMYMIIWIL
jgi:hypothetical protein